MSLPLRDHDHPGERSPQSQHLKLLKIILFSGVALPTVTLTSSCLSLQPQHPALSLASSQYAQNDGGDGSHPDLVTPRGKITPGGTGQGAGQAAHITSALVALPVKEQV